VVAPVFPRDWIGRLSLDVDRVGAYGYWPDVRLTVYSG
ncbi:uncharacterized protein METZ01_LOCUS10514, partial [marine metagenome]